MTLFFLKIKNIKVKKCIEDKIRGFVNYTLQTHGNGIESIILFGSIARNEISYKNDKLLSDFDFLIITKHPTFLMKKDNKKYDNIDYELCYKSDLKRVPKNTYWFDIKNTGKTVYGKEMIHEIRNFNREEIPKNGSMSIIFNRMSHLISVFNLKHFKSISSEDCQKIVRESSKALFCSSDVSSICSEKYSPYLDKRIKMIKNNIFFKKQHKNIINDINASLSYLKRNKNDNCLKLWFRAKENLLFLVDFCIKRNIRENNWAPYNYIRFYYNMFKAGIIPKVSVNPHLIWRVALTHFLKSVEDKKINEAELEKSLNSLNKICFCKIPYKNLNARWVEIKKSLVNILTALPDF